MQRTLQKNLKTTDGILLIDKPEGITSNQLVQTVRKTLNIKKVGHCGTLDPFATGLMVLCINKATKLVPYLTGLDKEYIAQIQFGEERDTDDRTGIVTNSSSANICLEENKVLAVLEQFIGELDQVPPQYSAIKKNGIRAYELARNGNKVELEARRITIYKLELLELSKTNIKILVHCSKGTYIRSLAKDIGRALDSYAYLSELRRTKTGFFSIDKKQTFADINETNINNNILTMREALNFLPEFEVDSNISSKVYFGQKINSYLSNKNINWNEHLKLKLIDGAGRLIAIVDNEFNYLNVFHYENIHKS